jgi:hypothetical protein
MKAHHFSRCPHFSDLRVMRLCSPTHKICFYYQAQSISGLKFLYLCELKKNWFTSHSLTCQISPTWAPKAAFYSLRPPAQYPSFHKTTASARSYFQQHSLSLHRPANILRMPRTSLKIPSLICHGYRIPTSGWGQTTASIIVGFFS